MAIDSVSLTLIVDNVEQAVDFYVKRLGLFTKPESVSDSVSLELIGDCCFSLSLCDVSSNPELRNLVGSQSGNATFLTLPIDDTEEMENQLRMNSVEVNDRYELPYAEWLFVSDPFGNQIALCQDLTKDVTA